MMPAFLYSRGEPFELYDRESHTKALRTSGDTLPFISGVTNKIASASSALVLSFLMALGMTASKRNYWSYFIHLGWKLECCQGKEWPISKRLRRRSPSSAFRRWCLRSLIFDALSLSVPKFRTFWLECNPYAILLWANAKECHSRYKIIVIHAIITIRFGESPTRSTCRPNAFRHPPIHKGFILRLAPFAIRLA